MSKSSEKGVGVTRIDCTFYLRDFQLGPSLEEGVFSLIFWGEGLSLELDNLFSEDLYYLISEIEDGMRLSEGERREHEFDELLYQLPEPVPNRLRFCFGELCSLQALYQPPDRLWQMVFEDDEDGSQAHVMMSTQQVSSLLERLKEKVAEYPDRNGSDGYH